MIKSDDGLYTALENAFAKSREPLTCAAIMDDPEVRAAALNRFGNDLQVATNKVSDKLGFMWRRGILDRVPAPPSRSMARFAYVMHEPEMPRLGKHAMSITEKDGEVVLDFKQFTVVIKPK